MKSEAWDDMGGRALVEGLGLVLKTREMSFQTEEMSAGNNTPIRAKNY